MVEFDNVEFQEGNLTAVALDGSEAIIASHSIASQGAVAGIVVSIDAPAAATGADCVLHHRRAFATTSEQTWLCLQLEIS